MAYVDLNPIRARMAKTPESSDRTSIKHRLDLISRGSNADTAMERFVGIKRDAIGIPFKLKDHVELVDWTGRIIRDDKRGSIQQSIPPILQRLDLNTDAWKILTTELESRFQCWVGSEHIVRRVCEDHGYQRLPPTHNHKNLFN